MAVTSRTRSSVSTEGTATPRAGSPSDQPQVTVVLVECAGQQLGLPSPRVEQVRSAAQVTRLPGAPMLIEGVVNLHGELVPVVDGRRRLGISHRDIRPSDLFVIVRSRGKRLVVHVDAAVGVVEVPAAELDEAASLHREAFRCKGISRLRGGLFVVHDMDALLSPHEFVRTEQAMAAPKVDVGNAGA